MTNYQEYLLSRVEDLFEDSEISEKVSYELRQAIRHGDPEPKYAGPGKGDTVIAPDEGMTITKTPRTTFILILSETGIKGLDSALIEEILSLQEDGNKIESITVAPDTHHQNTYLGTIIYSYPV